MRALAVSALVLLLTPEPAAAEPTSVTIAGSFQAALGCPTDWDPACPLTQLAFDPSDGVSLAAFMAKKDPADWETWEWSPRTERAGSEGRSTGRSDP